MAPIPRGVVDRPFLRKRLDAVLDARGGDAAVVTVLGPAGSGKTVFLRSWMRWRWSLDGAPGRWLELTEAHNDVVRLMHDLGELLADELSWTRDGAQAARPLPVVVDRLEILTSPASLSLLDGVVARPSPGLRLVLSGRRHALSSLSGAMLADTLVEFGPPDLDLTTTEARAMLLRAGHVLAPDEEATLLARADGWAAGLRFEMRRRLQPGRWVDDEACDPMLEEYVRHEVLDGLPPDDLDLLLRTSVVDEITPRVADDLTGRSDAGTALEAIERSNRLVRRVPGGLPTEPRFRCHPMLRACLRDHLHRRDRLHRGDPDRTDPAAAGVSAGRGREAGTHALRAVMAWHCHAILDVDGATAEAAALSEEVRRGRAPASVALAALCLEEILRLRADEEVGTSGAPGSLRSVWQEHARTSDAGLLAVVAPEVQQAALHLGATALADEVIHSARDRLPGSDPVSLMEAAEHAAHRRTAEAARWLAAVDLASPGGADPVTALRGRVLRAVLAARDGDRAAAHAALSQALAAADRTRVLAPFLDHPQEVSGILAEGLGRFGRLNALAEQVRGLVAVPGTDEELTEREAQVLTELASLRTVPEMADALGVSENTVKTHLRNVYRKLGTSSRRQTLLAARRGGLL